MDLATHWATVEFPVNHSVNLGVLGSSPSYNSMLGSVLLLLGPKMMCLTKEKDYDFWGEERGGAVLAPCASVAKSAECVH